MPEANTYGLPQGEPIAAALKAEYDRIAREFLDSLPHQGTELPAAFPDLGRHAEELASAVTPTLSVYWDDSGKRVMERLGLESDQWEVTNPHLEAQIHKQALTFCKSTLATTSKDINRAVDQLREELVAGLVAHGETLPQLRLRIQSVFERMSDWKADQIAATEASRAVHGAQLTADEQSGVVAGVELLLSADACPLCRKIATEAKQVQLGHAFAVIGSNPDYSHVRHPPIHPHCQCALIEILKPEWGGPQHVEWAETLQQPQKGLKDYEPPAGKEVPKPQPEKLAGRDPAEKADPERPRPGKVNLDIEDFIEGSTHVPRINRKLMYKAAEKLTPKDAQPVPLADTRVMGDEVGLLQGTVNQKIVEHYKDHPPDSPILVTLDNGLYYVEEGHHRVAAAVARGDTTIATYVFRPGPNKEPIFVPPAEPS